MANEHTDDDCEIMSKNYTKLKGTTTKSGYKDGAYDGRNSVFQSAFDVGYSEGFKNAFTIGQFQGLLSTTKELPKECLPDKLQTIDNSTSYDLLLKKATRGQCQVCQDPQLLNGTVAEISAIQTKHATSVHQALQHKYKAHSSEYE